MRISCWTNRSKQIPLQITGASHLFHHWPLWSRICGVIPVRVLHITRKDLRFGVLLPLPIWTLNKCMGHRQPEIIRLRGICRLAFLLALTNSYISQGVSVCHLFFSTSQVRKSLLSKWFYCFDPMPPCLLLLLTLYSLLLFIVSHY